MGGIHIKDCFSDYLDSDHGMTYHQVVATKRSWA
jgi:hypothetical protein